MKACLQAQAWTLAVVLLAGAVAVQARLPALFNVTFRSNGDNTVELMSVRCPPGSAETPSLCQDLNSAIDGAFYQEDGIALQPITKINETAFQDPDLAQNLVNMRLTAFGTYGNLQLPKDVFQGLNHLEFLNLDDNGIVDFHEEILDGLPSLLMLSLGDTLMIGNQITHLYPKQFDAVPYAQMLLSGLPLACCENTFLEALPYRLQVIDVDLLTCNNLDTPSLRNSSCPCEVANCRPGMEVCYQQDEPGCLYCNDGFYVPRPGLDPGPCVACDVPGCLYNATCERLNTEELSVLNFCPKDGCNTNMSYYVEYSVDVQRNNSLQDGYCAECPAVQGCRDAAGYGCVKQSDGSVINSKCRECADGFYAPLLVDGTTDSYRCIACPVPPNCGTAAVNCSGANDHVYQCPEGRCNSGYFNSRGSLACTECTPSSQCATVDDECTQTSDLECETCTQHRRGQQCQYSACYLRLTRAVDESELSGIGAALALRLEVDDVFIEPTHDGRDIVEPSADELKRRRRNTAVDTATVYLLAEDVQSLRGILGAPAQSAYLGSMGIAEVAIEGEPTVNIADSARSSGGSSKKTTAVAVGVVVGAVVVFALLLGFIGRQYYYIRREKLLRRPLPLPNDLPIAGYRQAQVNFEAMALRHGVVDRDQFVQLEKISEGQFGAVHKGALFLNGVNTLVALKILKGASSDDISEFMKEANLMCSLHFVNIVRFLGVSSDTAPPKQYVLLEYMELGDLASSLKDRAKNGNPASLVEKAWYGHQVAQGMAYLAMKHIVHRDLAARNVLLANPLPGTHGFPVTKISDFGMSRMVEDTEYYRITNHSKNTLVPVRWQAPEAMGQRKYTTATDVWSYGVLLWEIYSDGALPYKEIRLGDVYAEVMRGTRLAMPHGCPTKLYLLMRKCWEAAPEQRPHFLQLAQVMAASFLCHAPPDHLLAEQRKAEGALASDPNGYIDMDTASYVFPGGPRGHGLYVDVEAVAAMGLPMSQIAPYILGEEWGDGQKGAVLQWDLLAMMLDLTPHDSLGMAGGKGSGFPIADYVDIQAHKAKVDGVLLMSEGYCHMQMPDAGPPIAVVEPTGTHEYHEPDPVDPAKGPSGPLKASTQMAGTDGPHISTTAERLGGVGSGQLSAQAFQRGGSGYYDFSSSPVMQNTYDEVLPEDTCRV